MSIHLKDHEGEHATLYKVHWMLVEAANEIHSLLTRLYAAGRYQEDRAKLADPIEKLEAVRGKIDEALRIAGSVRSDLIRLTGCDGSCEKRPTPSPTQ
jgi:hypothetical protein